MASQKYANYDIQELNSIAERLSSEGQANASINDTTVQNINENGGALNDTIN